MRLLYFSRDYTTHDYRFLSKLGESDLEVFYLRLEDDHIEYENRPIPQGINNIDWQGGIKPTRGIEDWLELLPGYESVLSEIQPDIVHAGPVQSCGYLTALTDFHPFVMASWGSDILIDSDRDEKWRKVTYYSLDRSDMLLCDCQAVRNKTQQLISYSDDQIIQFPWGIDLQKFNKRDGNSALREELGWQKNFVILSTRSWEKIYGIDVLLKSFFLSLRQNSNLRLILLGDGSLQPDIKKFIGKHNLNDCILMPGIIPQELLPAYYRASDLYMSCTMSDGTSISLLEALATGLPVSVSDTPGNREWIEPNSNGWLSTSIDPKAFSDSILLAVNLSAADRDQISQKNQQLAIDRANWDKNFDKLLTAYDQLLSH